VTQDGEAIQHRPLDEDEVLKMLETERIDVGKGPASCSIVGNALDASKLFLTIKTALKQGEAPLFDSELEDRIVLKLAMNSSIFQKPRGERSLPAQCIFCTP